MSTAAYVPRHSITTDQRLQAERTRAAVAAAVEGRTGYAAFIAAKAALKHSNRTDQQGATS